MSTFKIYNLNPLIMLVFKRLVTDVSWASTFVLKSIPEAIRVRKTSASMTQYTNLYWRITQTRLVG